MDIINAVNIQSKAAEIKPKDLKSSTEKDFNCVLKEKFDEVKSENLTKENKPKVEDEETKVDENAASTVISDILIQMPQQENQVDSLEIIPKGNEDVLQVEGSDKAILSNSENGALLINDKVVEANQKDATLLTGNKVAEVNPKAELNEQVLQTENKAVEISLQKNQVSDDSSVANNSFVHSEVSENTLIKDSNVDSKQGDISTVEQTINSEEIKITQSNNKDTSKNENDFNQTSESKEQKLIKADDKEVSSEILQKPLQMIQITDNSTKLDKPVQASPNVQVAEAIKTNLSEGKKEFEIQLMPENLGKISVKLVLENGALSVEMKAVNPKTQSLLAENSAEIKSILENASLKAVDVPQQQTPQDYVQQQNKNQQQQNQQQQQKNNQEKNDTSTIDFISMIQQIKNKSIMA